MDNNKKVGIWLRVSTDEQAQGDSPAHHEERARMYAKVKDWEVAKVYHLEAVSGKSVIDHPEAQRMLSDIKKGVITGLIFSKLARLARNTKELLEFADYFKKYNADLISLQESIDTSSPAGKLLYTMIAALAEWEREEIASRVRASVPVRAKLGKPLGGAAPYGYQWNNQKLVLDENEAPVRKLMFELYQQEQRKERVCKILNERGYRTRKGAKFSGTTLTRLLRDPIAKGMRRMNYTQSRGEGKAWDIKDEKEWIMVPAPRIVSDELWESVNHILDQNYKKFQKMGRSTQYLFSGYLHCHCGSKMYANVKLKKYRCSKKGCSNLIRVDTMENIFVEHIQSFLLSHTQIQELLDRQKGMIQEKEREYERINKEADALQKRYTHLMNEYLDGNIPQEAFREHYQPLFDQRQQIITYLPELQGEIDAMKNESMSADQVLYDAQIIAQKWSTLSFQQKRSIVENTLKSIVVDIEDITINLSYLPFFGKGDIESDISLKQFQNSTQPQGFMLATRTKEAGKSTETRARDIETFRSSIG